MGNALQAHLGTDALATPEAKNELAQGLNSSVADAGGVHGDGLYLTFSGKTGRWRTGTGDNADKDYTYKGDNLLTTPQSFEMGHTLWSGGKVVRRIMWPVAQANTHPDALYIKQHGLPAAEKVTDSGDIDEQGQPIVHRESLIKSDADGWQETRACTFYALDGDYAEEELKFSTNSKSGINSFTDLAAEVSARLTKGEPFYPVVNLESDSFTSRDNHKNYKPIFKASMWLDDTQAHGVYEGTTTPEEIGIGAAETQTTTPVVAKKARAKKATARPPNPAESLTQTTNDTGSADTQGGVANGAGADDDNSPPWFPPED